MSGIRLGTRTGGKSVYLPERARATHMQVIGASGTGKTKFLENLIREDILAGNGLCLIDPTGNLYHDLVTWCETRGFLGRKPVVLFDPADPDWTFGFNPLNFAGGPNEDLSFSVDSMVKACATVWGGEDTDKTPLLKRCLRATFHVLAEQRLTLLEAVYLINPYDPTGLRRHLTRTIHDFIMQEQWDTFNPMKPREFQEQFSSTANRLLEFLASERIRRILGQRENTLSMRSVMDEGGMLLVNLSSGRSLSEANASLLGALLVNDLFLKARGRPKGSRPFYVYIDECSRFVSEDIGRILDEGRQFGLHLILAHQHLAQLKRAGEAVYGAVLTDARTKVVFGGLSPEDAEIMGDLLYMGELDFEEAKKSLIKPVVVGQEMIRLESAATTRTHGATDTTGRTVSRGMSTTTTKTRGTSAGENASYGADTGDLPITPSIRRSWNSGTQAHQSVGKGTSESTAESTSRSVSESRGETTGWSESLASIYQERPTAVFSLEEQRHRKAAFLRNLCRQKAVIKMPERESVAFRATSVEFGVANAERVGRFKRDTFIRSAFVKPTKVVDALLRIRKSRLERQAAAGSAPSPAGPDDFLE